MSFLDELNPQQREAVETTEGPVLILAGAGSGKTRVITFRIAYLIETLGVMPESILAVTFTNKAASEMAERVEKLVGGLSVAKPVISTFHSFCVRVLRRDVEALRIPSTVPGQPPIGLTKNFVIYDESDQQQVVKGVMRRMGLDDKQLTPRNVLSRISWAKNHMLDPQEIYLQSADPKMEKIAHVFEEYRKELRKANAMDFDDLLLEAMRLLKSVAAVREYYNRRFQYLLVDEYQDTNRPQYELMRLLAGAGHNVCAVGDEDQSIYSWRGADIRNILEFERDFPEAKIVRLEQNYRSTQNILEAASVVVANNVRRKGKNLWTSRQGGAKIGYYEAPDGENEALFAADTINKYIRSAGESGETPRAAVLYRTNSQSRLFEEAMRRYGLKYHVVGGFSFYERAEIKDLISYLKVIQNPDDSVSLLRVINTPARGIGKTTIETIERLGLETGLSMWGAVGEAIQRQLLPARALVALKSFRDVIEDGRAMLAGKFRERVEETVEPIESAVKAESGDQNGLEFGQDAIDFSPGGLGGPDGSERGGATANSAGKAPDDSERSTAVPLEDLQPEIPPAETTENGKRVFRVDPQGYADLQKTLRRLAKGAARLRIQAPTVHVHEVGPVGLDGEPSYYRLSASGELTRINGWKFRGAIRHREGTNELHPLPGESFPEGYEYAGAICDHCGKDIERNFTFIVERQVDGIKQLGSTCVDKYLPFNAKAHVWFVESLFSLQDELEHYSKERIQSESKKARRPPERYEYSYPVSSPRELLRGSIKPTQGESGQGGAEGARAGDETDFDPSNFSFDFEAHDLPEQERAAEGARLSIDNAVDEAVVEGFRAPGEAAHTGELLKFLIDRTGYIKILEEEDTPEAYSRIENLRELVNAAMDSKDRGETLDQFLDHAALVSDADQYDEGAQITLMTLHAAKGLEFPLVVLAGMEEGLFPHSRTMLEPDSIEEERRLCYVGMTRAMDTLVLSRAVYRRRYGTDMPEASVPSRFLEEVPPQLVEEMGGSRRRTSAAGGYSSSSYSSSAGSYSSGSSRTGRPRPQGPESHGAHYSYEDEDQSATWDPGRVKAKAPTPVKNYNSIDNIAEFFASRGKRFSVPKMLPEEPEGKRGFRPGQKVRHPKYGEGTVYQREGDGEDAKITVQFPRFGLKKLVERYAQLEKA